MALFKFSNNWETNERGDELCETFIKDGTDYKKKKKNKNNPKSKQKHIYNSDDEPISVVIEISSDDESLQNHSSKNSRKTLKRKKHKKKKENKREEIKKKIHSTTDDEGDDKIPLYSFESSELKKAEKYDNKKRSKRKRSLSETGDENDNEPLLKKVKTEKKVKNYDVIVINRDSPTSSKTKKVKKKLRNGETAQEPIPVLDKINHLKKIQRLIKNVETEKIIKKIPKKKEKPDAPTVEKHLEETKIDPVQLKKRKMQIEKLQKLLLEKKEKQQSLVTKKEEPILTLRQKMMEKLKAARFRFLNEQIYTTTSRETEKIFKRDPDAFKAYHEGYRQQVKRWPLNPLDKIIKFINKMPKSYVVADFGCGEAKLASSVEQKVYSFDLVAASDKVTACDMAHVPLQDSSVEVAVFCLSLMGTNLNDYLLEANRVLKKGGFLKIAEVESRFEDINVFTKDCEHFGFKKIWMDLSHNLFYFIDFRKEGSVKGKKKLPSISLQPCLYKKR